MRNRFIQADKEEFEMSRLKLTFAIICLCVMSSVAWAQALGEEATRFFKTHPNAIDLVERGDSILFANKQIGLEFKQSARGFQISRLYGIAEDQDFLTGAKGPDFRDLFEIRMTLDPKWIGKDERGKSRPGGLGIMETMAGDAFVIGSSAAKSVSSRREGTDSELVLRLEWKGIDVRENKGVLDAEIMVTLRAGDPLSYWRINVRNRSQRYGIERVRFPLLTLAPIGKAEENVFLFPKWRGGLMENPFSQPAGLGENYHTTGAFYPLHFNMQFQALYNKESNKGIYLGTRDSAPNLMNVQIINTPSEIAWRPGHFPPNITFSNEDFPLPYDCVAGPFRGDWYDACQIYRKWAVKQPWCRKGRLSTRRDIPKWYKETPLFFYVALNDSAEGTHSPEANMHIGADHFREFLKWGGMRLPVNWYGWKQYTPDRNTFNVPFSGYRLRSKGRWVGLPTDCAYVGNYPKPPALPGFSATCKSLREEGGMVCPYVILQMFDQGASENSPYAAEAKSHMSRGLYGSILKYGAYHAWLPCVHAQWWRDRLKETCVLMLERENVSGFYLDVMHGAGQPCYWTPHGHSAAGGSSMTEGMHGLAKGIRDAVKAKDPEVITTGEDATENMIDVIDGILYQRTLRPENRAPIFAAVYQDYIPRYGLELSVQRSDDFFIECASLFVEGAQIGRVRLRPRSRSLSFQKPEHKEMLDFLKQMVEYYKQERAKKFLVYGRLLRPLTFSAPSPMPMLAYGKNGQFPALMSGVFRSNDGELGVFVVNAGTKGLDFQADMDLTRYGMTADTIVDVDKITSGGTSQKVLSKQKAMVVLKGLLPAHGITMFLLRSAN